MGKAFRSIFIAMFCSGAFSFSLLAEGVCTALLRGLDRHREMQPQILRIKEGPARVFFHNRELESVFSKGLSAEALRRGIDLLETKGSLDIRVTEEGYVVAADSRGSYSEAIWARDSARIAHSLPAKERAKVLGALLTMMANPLNIELFALNIRDSNVHKMSDDELRDHLSKNWNPLFEGLTVTSTMFVPHIRFLVAQLKDPSVKPERWNMKQNDGLALVLIESILALKEGVLKWEDLSERQKLFFGLTVAYSIHTQFWEKWDAGAWEEANGRRTSSVGLFTEALSLFENSDLRGRVEESIASSDLIPADLKSIIKDVILPDRLKNAISNGRNIVLHQLSRGEAPDRFDPAPQGKRLSDAALAHLLWYPPSYFGEQEFRILLTHLDRLRRASGTIRYEGDVYLTVGQCLPPDETIPIDLLRDRVKRGTVTVREIQNAFWNKDSAFMEGVYGQSYEAQWVLADLILVQFLPKLIERYPDSPHRSEYEARLNEAILRMFGFITGVDVDGQGPLAMDGLRVKAWSFPEAWLPVRVYRDDGTVETLWTTSKFTPLNWANAEAREAVRVLKYLLSSQGSGIHSGSQMHP